MKNHKRFSITFILSLLFIIVQTVNADVIELVKDINPGTASSNPSGLIGNSQTLYFAATNSTYGYELWRSDGTETGTTLVKDINPGSTGGLGSWFPQLYQVSDFSNELIFFLANDGITGVDVWKSDGTDSGTQLLKDIDENTGNFWDEFDIAGNSTTIFFPASNNAYGAELWKSDATVDGTTIVKDIRAGSNDSIPYGFQIKRITDSVFFKADDGVQGRELWKSDGTINGTTIVVDLNPGSAQGLNYAAFVVDGTQLFFSGDNSTTGTEFWKTNGSESGTVLVADINPGTSGSFPDFLAGATSPSYFLASDNSGRDLWLTDGTTSGTIKWLNLPFDVWVADATTINETTDIISTNEYSGGTIGKLFASNYITGATQQLIQFNNEIKLLGRSPDLSYVIFIVDDGINGKKLWRTDGTIEGTNYLIDPNLQPTFPSTDYSYSARVGNDFYFVGEDAAHGRELWKIDLSQLQNPSITLQSPNGGEVWQANTLYDVVYSATNVSSVTLEYSLNNGFNWYPMSATTVSSGSFSWLVPPLTTSYALVRATADDNSVYDISDAAFSIINPCSNSLYTNLQTNWTLVDTNGPGNLVSHSMAFDIARQKVVLYGGGNPYTTNTWEWDGNSWSIVDSNGPHIRAGGVMNYDPIRKQVIMFGGSYPSQQYLNDLWAWDGTQWTQLSSGVIPARDNMVSAFDYLRDRFVVFGGGLPGIRLNDLWEWNGNSWEYKQNGLPSNRGGGEMVYDPIHQNSIMYGGADSSVTDTLDNTWYWDGTNWSINYNAQPGYLSYEGLAYDSCRGRVVMHGGISNTNTILSNTWEWDGNSWSLLGSNGPARWWSQMVFDPINNKFILFGGNDGTNYTNETWELQLDSGPLDIVSVSPEQNEISVSPNTSINAEFNQAMVNGTTQSFTVHGSMSGFRSGVYSGGGTNTLTFDPSLSFFPGEKIEVTLSTAAISTSMINSTSPFVTQFISSAGIGPASFSNRSSVLSTGIHHTRWGLEVGDMDNDNDLDIVFGRTDTSLPNLILWNNGFGEFNSSTQFGNANFYTSEFELGDVDHDGDLDIVSIHDSSAPVVLYFNNGPGQFNSTLDLGIASLSSIGIAMGDVNGDSHLDIIVGNYGQQNKIYINDGFGGYSEERNFGSGSDNTIAIEVADVDNDGDLDIATASNLSTLNQVYLNDGLGFFGSSGIVYGSNPTDSTHSIAFADFNNDGNIDIVEGNGNQSKVHLNDGNGGFNTTINLATTKTYHIKTGDVDGDGDIDIVHANENFIQNVIQINDGNANFTPLNFGTGSDNSSAVELGDLDKDGDLDIVLANFSEPNVIYFNDTSSTATPIFHIIPPSPGIDCDSMREYKVSISDASAVVGYRVAVVFDTSQATYVPASADVLGTSAATDFDSLTVNDTTPGQLIFTNASDNQPLDAGPATLLKFSFDFADSLIEGSSFSISFLPITNLNDGAIDSDNVDLIETVNPVNDPPTFLIPNPFVQRLEDEGAQSIIEFATNISPGDAGESGQQLTFHIEVDDESLFAATPVISSTGTLSFTSAPNANGITSATVYLTDDGGVANCGIDTSTLAFFTIEVLPVNDAPNFAVTSTALFIQEDDPAQSIIGFATNITVGPVNESTQGYQFITQTNNNALFSVTPVIDVTGTLTYTPALNANGVAEVTVVIQDDGGTVNGGINSSTKTFSIIIFAVNDEPTIGAVDTVFLLEDSGVNIVNVSGISDGDPELEETLFESLSFTNPSLIAAASFIVPASSATGTVEIIPALNEFGSSIFTLTVQDSGFGFPPHDNIVSTTFIVNVSPVNDAPSFIKGASQNILNVTGGTRTVVNWASGITAGPTNEANQLLNFSVDTDQPGLFAIAPAVTPDGTLSFTPAANAHGIANVSLSINDDGGTAYGGINASATDTFVVTSYTQFLWGDLNIDNVSGTVDASLILRFDAALLPTKTVFGATFQEFPGYPIEQYSEYFLPRAGTLPFPPLSATFPLAFPPAANVAGNDNEAGVLDAAQLLRVAALLDDFVQSDTSFDGIGPDAPIFLTKQVNRSQVIPRSLLVDLIADRSDTVSNAFTAWNMNFFVDNGKDLSGFRIALTYDPAVVEIDEFGVEALSGAVIVVNDTLPGRLIVSGALINIPGAGPAEILSVRMVSASSSEMLIDSIRVDVDESLTRLNDGALQLSAQSISEVLLSETTNVNEWMIWE